ncbi:sulfotransferase 6B1-like [Empidonax traillii]|uniref:sulfotransferase 6B1-like n=1 Tax=Empidonax traillii TaxID=164674 RepID=UPI000FFCE8DA|nr:sulfotransferase 6B1-like [Empidonax traillii]
MDKPRKKITDFVEKAEVVARTMRRDELLFSYNGILYPVTVCSPETFRALESFEARSDDIILAGYPKSELSYSLPSHAMLHFFRLIRTDILLLIRNPKDVATSYYHFSNGMAIVPSYETWDDFFTDFMSKRVAWGCYFEYLSQWNKYADEENVMTITYEELKENRLLGVKKIAAFLGISLTEEELQLVVERSSFQAMKKNSQKTHGAFGDILFRKGGVSDWKNLFSEDQNEKMDKAFEEYVGGTKLGKKLKYEVYCKA